MSNDLRRFALLCTLSATATLSPWAHAQSEPATTTPSDSSTAPPADAPAPTAAEATPETAPADVAQDPAKAQPAEPVNVAATEGASSNPPGEAAPPTPAPTSADAAELMAQLDAQLASSGASESVGGSNLHLYGFADVSYYKYFIRQHSPFGALLYPKNAFAVGNLNVYLSGELSDHWRSLAEVRFTYLPNGNRIIDATGIHRTDTSVNDYTHLDQARRTGSIFIERAWLEYEASTALTVRAGSWLTPYGIWNEDHGSPTIIPVARPYVIGLELLPERQTGVMAFGSFYPSENLTLGYAVGVSNGRGPVQDYADLDERKALTLRFTGSYRSTGVFTFGASAYLGRYTDTQQVLTTVNGAARIDDRIVRQYDEVSVGLDARYVIGGFHAQAELISNQQAFTPEGRPIRIGTQFEPDGRRFGGYAIVGYRFKWLGLMPYVTGEYFSLNNTFEPTRPPTVDVYTDYAFGLNSRPTNDVTLKLEGTVGVFFVDHAEGSAFQYPVPAVQAQAAWVF